MAIQSDPARGGRLPGVVSTVTSARRRSPSIAAFLSFLWPGLGQWYAGRPRAALLFAVPIAIVLIVFLAWLARGIEQAVFAMLLPSVALTFAIVIVLAGAWRIGSSGHAAYVSGGRAAFRKRATAATLVVVTLVVAVTHLWAASVAWSFYRAGDEIFVPPVAVNPDGPGAAPSDGFFATPLAPPPTADSRINILLTGIDSSESRSPALTDTLIVVSVAPATGKVSMVSFPRDIARFNEPDGTKYRGKINSLMTYATNHPDRYPDG